MIAMAQTDWRPGLLILGLGVAITLIVFFSTRRKATPAARDVRLADLEIRLRLLLEQLRGLETERHHLGAGFDAEKARLEREAAEAMRARDLHLLERAPPSTVPVAQQGPGMAAPRPQASGGLHPQLKGALWGSGVVLFFVAVIFSLSRWESERGEDGVMTGRTPPGNDAAPLPGPPPEAPQLREALARAKAEPRDVEAASLAAHELIRQQRFDEADGLTRQALAADPFHLESRIHQAVLRATQGELRPALDQLGQLAQNYPEAWEAMLFRGVLALQIGESRVALESFERFQAEAPPDEHPPELESAIDMLRQRVQGR